MSYNIETSFAFPIIRLNTIIKSTKVEKPTGVSYFLLVLINENKDKTTVLVDTLRTCGVPEDLQSLFADELQTLINLEIISVKGNRYNKQNFVKYKIADFKFTTKGKKIFLEESIPLGHNEEVKQPVFYNVALDKLYINENNHLRDSSQSILDDKFFSKIKTPNEKTLESFFNTQKSRQIPIKAEEVILDVKVQTFDQGFDTFDFFINIYENDTVSFDFADSKLQKYFEKNYNNEMITKGILLKNKFIFYVPTTYYSKLSDHLPILNIYRPKDAEKCYSRAAHLNIYQEGYESINNKLAYQNDQVLNSIYKNSAFMKIVSLERGYVFIPTYLKLNNDIFGEIKLSVLIEKELSKEEIKQAFIAMTDLFTAYDANKENPFNYKNLIELCKLDKTNKTIISKVNDFIGESNETGIVTLEKIKDDSVGNPEIYTFVKSKSLELYRSLFKNVTLDNLEHYAILTNWIARLNKLSEGEQLKVIFDNLVLKTQNEKVATFKILENLNFKPANLVLFMKEIPQLFYNDKESNSDYANEIQLLFNQKNELQKLTNISDLQNYIISDHINRKTYMTTYKSFTKTYAGLMYLKDYLIDEFVELERYNKIFKDLNELYQKEEELALNPHKIDKKTLLNVIKTSTVLTATAYIYVKLSHVAKKTFVYKGDIYNFVDKLYHDKKITKDEQHLFHKFRMYRNDLGHANIQRVRLTAEELNAVVEIIFRLEQQKDE